MKQGADGVAGEGGEEGGVGEGTLTTVKGCVSREFLSKSESNRATTSFGETCEEKKELNEEVSRPTLSDPLQGARTARK